MAGRKEGRKEGTRQASTRYTLKKETRTKVERRKSKSLDNGERASRITTVYQIYKGSSVWNK